MTSTRVGGAAVFLFFVSFSLAASWAKQTDSHEADSAAITKLFTDFNDALNNHDAHANLMLFTDDADFINGQGATDHGGAGVEQHMATAYAGRGKAMHRDVTLRAIHFLRPDVATVVSEYTQTGVAGRNGAAVSRGLYDWIVMKQNGRWLIVFWHESNLPEPPPPPTQ